MIGVVQVARHPLTVLEDGELAHTLLQAGVLDGNARSCGESDRDLLVRGGEVAAATLLGEVQIAEHAVLDAHRHAEEGAHRRVALREPEALRMAAQVAEPQGPRFADEHAENAPPHRVMADPTNGLLVRALGDELDETDLLNIGSRPQDTEGRVLSVDELARAADDAPQDDRESDRTTSP